MYQEIKLISKRNEVFRIVEEGKSYILKRFTDQKDMKREIEILELLNNKGIKVPLILGMKENALFLEDLGTNTLLEWYETQEKKKLLSYGEMLRKLLEWIKQFYSVTSEYYEEQMILTDINFRNFILKDEEIYGIDFEQVQPGRIEVDAGKIVAFALTYEPVMTKWKWCFCNEFIEIFSTEFNMNKDFILKERDFELKEMEKRRGARFL